MYPLIGIPCRAKADGSPFYNDRTYTRAVEHAGGMPILIPILDDPEVLRSFLPMLDGLLLSGGSDIDPHTYQEEPHPALGRIYPPLDTFHLELTRWAFEQQVPTLGICRGMQIINVALGGNLYQDLTTQYPSNIQHAGWDLAHNTIIHQVVVKPGSMLERIFGQREVSANSRHHQAVKDPGQGVIITGQAEDGVAEALEVPEHPFMVAVQCHPEDLYMDWPVWSRLFRAFIFACNDQHLYPDASESLATIAKE